MILPNLLTSKLIVPVATLLVGTWTGYYFTSNYYVAKEVTTTKAIVQEMTKQLNIERDLLNASLTKMEKIEKNERYLRNKLKETKLTLDKCTLTSDAISLWNQSLLGEGELPKNSKGVASGEGTDFATAFENKLANDLQCNKLREQLDAIRKWDKETFE
jgi:hypothetical protein